MIGGYDKAGAEGALQSGATHRAAPIVGAIIVTLKLIKFVLLLPSLPNHVSAPPQQTFSKHPEDEAARAEKR